MHIGLSLELLQRFNPIILGIYQQLEPFLMPIQLSHVAVQPLNSDSAILVVASRFQEHQPPFCTLSIAIQINYYTHASDRGWGIIYPDELNLELWEMESRGLTSTSHEPAAVITDAANLIKEFFATQLTVSLPYTS